MREGYRDYPYDDTDENKYADDEYSHYAITKNTPDAHGGGGARREPGRSRYD